MDYCSLPSCRRLYSYGYGVCCCRSHQNTYSALIRHGKISDPKYKPKPKFKKYKSPYKQYKLRLPMGPTKYKDKTPEQRGNWIFYVIQRRKKIKQATPKWANLESIKSFYVDAQRLSKSTGIAYEVDHIIPITGENVCGLHVESNLQILTEKHNKSKSNKF